MQLSSTGHHHTEAPQQSLQIDPLLLKQAICFFLEKGFAGAWIVAWKLYAIIRNGDWFSIEALSRVFNDSALYSLSGAQWKENDPNEYMQMVQHSFVEAVNSILSNEGLRPEIIDQYKFNELVKFLLGIWDELRLDYDSEFMTKILAITNLGGKDVWTVH